MKLLPKIEASPRWQTVAPHQYLAHKLLDLLKGAAPQMKCEGYDSGIDGSGTPGRAMMDFRNGYQCAELLHVLRGMTEQAAEWGMPLFFAQQVCARA